MAQNKIYKFKDIDHANLFLNGAIFGAPVPGSGYYYGLVGLKLKFSAPAAAECTFVAGASPQGLTFQEVKAQLEAAIAGLTVRTFGGAIVFIETTPTSGVSIVAASVPASDARGYFGLDIASTISSKVYKPSVVSNAAPCWTWADTNNENAHIVYTWE